MHASKLFSFFSASNKPLADNANHQAQRWQTNINKPKASHKLSNGSHGKVIFIGAGSGDVELLTIKAVKALQQAEVILVDWLVNPDIQHYFPDAVEVLFVGKKCGQHSMSQTQINQLLVTQAELGKTVVRLKGGDPSIFARLAEETEALTQAQIPFQIIPGITAASGCAAYAGIPLTHRDCAQSVKFVTAHFKQQQQQCNWQQLAQEQGTLVFYMGLNRVQQISEQLVKYGMRADMPIAVIDQGTSKHQQLHCSTLAGIKPATDLANFKGPALINLRSV